MKQFLRLALVAATLSLGIFSCTDSERVNTDSAVGPTLGVEKKNPPPPGNSNPAFAFEDNYQVNGHRSVPAIFVMDVTGENKTKVYSNYASQWTENPDYPAWSGDGTKICFTVNQTDLYTLSISLINGYPVGSNPVKIGDGAAGGGNYRQGKWRPGANQIACVWKRTGDPDKIHSIPSTGGSPSILYTSASTDWTIEDDIAFRSDGSRLVFSERQLSTGDVFLNVLDVSTGDVIKTTDMSQFKSIAGVDWAKSLGSDVVAIETVPFCDTPIIGHNGFHEIYTIDVGSSTPSLTLLITNRGGISWSPTDDRITISSGVLLSCFLCCTAYYDGIGIFTLATQSITYPSYTGGNHYDWKR